MPILDTKHSQIIGQDPKLYHITLDTTIKHRLQIAYWRF